MSDQTDLGEFYDPADEFVDVDELRDLGGYHKGRRLKSPEDSDDWPGTWEVYRTGATRLPSWKNDDGQVIRFRQKPMTGVSAFVHKKGTETWEGKLARDIHDPVLEYMEANP